jgi:hypothetical protein
MSDRDELLALIKELAVVHGKVTLSSGLEADYYIDLRRITLHAKAAPLVGRVMRELTNDWDYDVVGGLTLGADPVATAIMHASAGTVDACVVRKAEKKHGMQRRVEGPDVSGRREGGRRWVDRGPWRLRGDHRRRSAVSSRVLAGRPRLGVDAVCVPNLRRSASNDRRRNTGSGYRC